MTAPVKRTLAYEATASELQSAILEGEFPPGSRLPDEGELGERFGVGRSTIREALRLLGGRGYVRIAVGSGGGAFVNSVDPTMVGRGIADDLVFLMGGEGISASELAEAREVQELSAVRLATRRAGPGELDRIQDLAEMTVDLVEDAEGFVRANLDFHMAIAAATHNRVLHLWIGAFHHVVEQGMREAIQTDDIRRHVAAQHLAIAAAIAARDEEVAVRLMGEHLEDFCTDLIQFRTTGRPRDRS